VVVADEGEEAGGPAVAEEEEPEVEEASEAAEEVAPRLSVVPAVVAA
jgi:hypothetical protein